MRAEALEIVPARRSLINCRRAFVISAQRRFVRVILLVFRVIAVGTVVRECLVGIRCGALCSESFVQFRRRISEGRNEDRVIALERRSAVSMNIRVRNTYIGSKYAFWKEI